MEFIIAILVMIGVICILFLPIWIQEFGWWYQSIFDDLNLNNLDTNWEKRLDMDNWLHSEYAWHQSNEYKEIARKRAIKEFEKNMPTLESITKAISEMKIHQIEYDSIAYNIDGVDEYMYFLQSQGIKTYYSPYIEKGKAYLYNSTKYTPNPMDYFKQL